MPLANVLDKLSQRAQIVNVLHLRGGWVVLATKKELLHYPEAFVEDVVGAQVHGAEADNTVAARLHWSSVVACEELTSSPCPQVHVQTYGAEVVVVFKHPDQVSEGVGAEHEVTGVTDDADGPVRVVEAHVFGRPRILLVAHETHVQLRPQAYVVLVYAAHGSADALEVLLLQR